MKTQAWFLCGIAGFSMFIGGCLLLFVHYEVVGMHAGSIPIGMRFFAYPLAVLTYFAGLCACLFSCFSRTRRRLYVWPVIGMILSLISMMLLLITWLSLIHLHVMPFGISA